MGSARLRPSGIAAAGAAVAAVVAGLSMTAAGSTPVSAPSGPVYLYSDPTDSGTTGSVVLVGAVADYGTYAASDEDGKLDPNGNYIKVILHKGTFQIQTALEDAKTFSDKATCSAVFSGSAPGTLFHGTGLYGRIHGNLRLSQAHALLGGRYTSGPKKGKCKVGGSNKPIAEYNTLSANGNVSFG